MTVPLDLTVEFSTERFDYASDLPAEYNAGNRFYGRDVAEYVCEALEPHGVLCEFLDEDWGWLVLGHENSDPRVEICVYHWQEHDDSPSNVWRLRVCTYVREPCLFIFRKRRELPNSRRLVEGLRSAFAAPEFRVRVFGHSDDW